MKEIIYIDQRISMHQGITSAEGISIYEEILSKIKDDKLIELDFKDVELMTTAFLNVVIGQLYKEYSSEELKAHLTFANLSKADALRIKKVTDNAKLFYQNQDAFTKQVEEIINGKD